MKISKGKIQRLISEELTRAATRRQRESAGETMFEVGVDLCEVMKFAKGFAALTESERDDVSALMDGSFDDIQVTPVKMKDTVGGVHPELDEAIEEYNSWFKTQR